MNLFELNPVGDRPDPALAEQIGRTHTANSSDAMAKRNTMDLGIQAVVPDDIVVGDVDGMGVVPRRKAREVVWLGQAIVTYEEELQRS